MVSHYFDIVTHVLSKSFIVIFFLEDLSSFSILTLVQYFCKLVKYIIKIIMFFGCRA